MSHDQKKIKRAIIEVLQEVPIITHAVKKVGISRMTLHRWIKKDAVFERNLNAAIMEGHKNMIDMSESALMKKIKEGHFGAIKFHLENNHRNYMSYKYRVQVIPDRNTDDSFNCLYDKIPRISVLDEELSQELSDFQSIEAWSTMTREQQQYYINIVENGDSLKEYFAKKRKNQENENHEE